MEQIDCPVCMGKGERTELIRQGQLRGEEVVTCGRCRGTGKVPAPPPIKVEFLVVWTDHTWTTEIHAIPQAAFEFFGKSEMAAVKWAKDTLSPQAKYGQVAMFAVYSWPQE